MLSALKTGCVFQPSCVSPQVVLRGAPDTLSVKPFLSRSFVVCSTCWVGIWVREVIKCNRCVVGGLTFGTFFKLRGRVFWAAFGHVVELGLEKLLITMVERCRRE